MTNHWEIIESVLEDERDRHIINGGKAEHRKELDAALAFVREQRAQPMTDGLLPCPFCGSKAELQWESSQGVVSCTNEECYATSTWFSSDNASEVREYVTAKWNRRVPPAPQAATVQGQPQPDWDKAPAWAMWWACNASGSAKWFGSKPEVSLDRDYGDWVSSYRYVRDDALHRLPLGIDWRITLTQRAVQPAEKGGGE